MGLRSTARFLALVAGVGTIVGMVTATRAENWPQFRGPAASGIVAQSQLPSTWSAEKNIAWKAKLPGVAWSQPVVWDERIFVTSAITENQQPPAVGGPGGGRGGPNGPPGARRGARGDREDGPRPGNQAEGNRREGGRPEAERGEGARPDEERRGQRGPGGRGGFGRSAQPPDQLYRWVVMCLDRDSGKLLWERVAHEGKPTIPTHRSNTFASETPIVDGERVYAYFGMTGLYCYDLGGKLLWKKDLGSFPMSSGWGTGSSPALEGDRLFVQCDNEEASFLVALDKRTGDELWRVDREEESNWSTPYVWKNKHRTELVTAGGGKMRSYDPATGKVLWEVAGISGRCSATPVGTDDLLYVGVGGGRGGAGPLVAIRASAEGELDLADTSAESGIAWSTPRAGPPMASPLIYDGAIYVLEQRGGIISCYDAQTGKERYKKRLEGAAGFTASPWAFDGKIYCLDETGQTFVIAPGPEPDVQAINKLDDQFWSSAAVAGNHLLLRGVNYLYSIAPE